MWLAPPRLRDLPGILVRSWWADLVSTFRRKTKRMFPVLVDGRIIAHIQAETKQEAARDFRVSQSAGWFPPRATLGDRDQKGATS